jgi:hypothetical protein
MSLVDETDWLEVLNGLLEVGNLGGAEAFAHTIDEPWQRAEALCRVAKVLVKVNDLEGARRVWSEAVAVARDGEHCIDIQDSLDCASVLAEISLDMLRAGEVAQAKGVAQSIRNEWRRNRALSIVARVEDELGR